MSEMVAPVSRMAGSVFSAVGPIAIQALVGARGGAVVAAMFSALVLIGCAGGVVVRLGRVGEMLRVNGSALLVVSISL